MVTKKVGLFLVTIFCALLFTGLAMCADPAISPLHGEVGTTATITVDPDALNDRTVTFDQDPAILVTIAKTTTTGTITAIPKAIAGVHQFKVTKVGVGLEKVIDFTVDNSKPIVGALDKNAKIGEVYTGTIAVTDANGDLVDTCTLTGGPTNLKIRPSADDKSCELYFDTTDGKPLSSSAGDYSLKVKAKDNSVTPLESDEKTIAFSIDTYVKIVSMTMSDKTGDSKTRPGDTVDFKLKVENNLDNNANLDESDQDINDAELHVECDDLDIDEEISFDIDAGKSVEKTISVVIPYDANEDDSPYTFTITFTGDDGTGAAYTTSKTDTLDIKLNDYDIILTSILSNTDKTKCGSEVLLSFDLVNIGAKDEEDIIITIKNDKLGISQQLDTIDALGTGESKSFKNIKVPISEKAYDGKFELEIRAESGDASDVATKAITLENCEGKFLTIDQTSAISNPKGTLKFAITLENIGSAEETYEIKVVGVDTFGTYNLSATDPKAVKVAAGSTENIELTLTINKDAEIKDYTPTLEIYLAGKKIASEELTITIEKASLLTGFATMFGDGGTTGLSLLVVLAVAIVAYMGFTLWKRYKPKAEGSDELEPVEPEAEKKPKNNKKKDKPKKKGNIFFEDEG